MASSAPPTVVPLRPYHPLHPPHIAPLAQAAQIPGDRLLLDAAREAATQLLAQTPDPGQWSAELRALVADDSLLQLDTHSLPTLD